MEKNNEGPLGDSYILRDLRIDGSIFPSNVGILTLFSKSFTRSLGDRVSFTGRLTPPSADLDGFDYRKYLLLRSVYMTTKASFVEKIGNDTPDSIVRGIRDLRENLLRRILMIYPGESAVLLGGILIGERTSLSDATKTDFNRSGLTHIIAVSGSNITILLIFLSLLVRPFPRGVQALSMVLIIALFTLLVGFQAPVMRASIFGSIAYVFLLAERRVRIFPLLIGIALLFCLYDPFVLTYDTSFQLSFLAVF